MIEYTVIRVPGQADLLTRFYDELYLPAFALQREPLEAWIEQLWGAARSPYYLSILLAGERLDVAARARIHGGIVSELYPESQCALLTYMVVAPRFRRHGLGRALLDGARQALHARSQVVFGEVSDPARVAPEHAAEAHARIARFERWGARLIEQPYIQPCLGPGLSRDRALRLIAFEPLDAPQLPGATLRAFLHEFYAVTEHIEPAADPELGPLLASIPDQVALRRM